MYGGKEKDSDNNSEGVPTIIYFLIVERVVYIMRFCDLFISYKIGLKGLKTTIPFTKLPLHRKVAVVLTFSLSLFSVFLLILKCNKIALVTILLAVISPIIFLIIDSRKNNLQDMLENHYSPSSHERMGMVLQVLGKYHIDISNMQLIDMLISEAKVAQLQHDYLLPLKKPLKTLEATIIPIVVYVEQKIGNETSQENILTFAIQSIICILLIFSIVLALKTIVKDTLYRDYNKYDNFISDLNQIKIFYSHDNDNSVSIE